MSHFTIALSLALFVIPVVNPEAQDNDKSPVVFWASDPIQPDDTIMLMGGFFHGDTKVLIHHLENITNAEDYMDDWTIIAPLQISEQNVKFVIPQDWGMGVFACRVFSGGLLSNIILINIPDIWWMQGDGGETASPGGWLRIFGKCLHFNKQTFIKLSSKTGNDIILPARVSSRYALYVDLPDNLEIGEYNISVHNGSGVENAWGKAKAFNIAKPINWPEIVFNVKEMGFDPALKAAEKNGGGVIYFPRGRYKMEEQIQLPSYTVLRGEGMGLVSLYWQDMDNPPSSLITGRIFGIQDLSIYCQNYKNVISDSFDSEGVFVERARIRANALFMQMEADGNFRERQAIRSHLETYAALRLVGKNFRITDCDIYATNIALALDPHAFTQYGPRFGLIARNTIRYGGRGYSFEAIDGLIFEDNDIQGNNLTSIGNDITTFWNNSSQHLYYANNRIKHIYGADREMMTLDAGGGAYFGKIEQVDKTKLVLASDPDFMDYAPKKHTDWKNAAVVILDGKGAGQYRRVVSNSGRIWDIDRSWDIEPDQKSLISIVPFRGRYLFIGNKFQDGGSFQLYGMSIDCIVAENTGTRMDGFFAWGRNPHGWGWQPSWYCQFLDNIITEGNGYGYRSAFIGTFTSDNDENYAGPLARAAIHRRNVLLNNSSIRINGTTVDAIVEKCRIANADRGIEIGGDTHGVLLRKNTFENVENPIYGEGIDQAIIK